MAGSQVNAAQAATFADASAVSVSMTVQNVDYAKLAAASELLQSFENVVKDAIVAESGDELRATTSA